MRPRTHLERSQTLFLLLQEPQDAPATLQNAVSAAVSKSSRSLRDSLLFLPLQEPQDAPATPLDAVSAAAATCNASLGRSKMLQRS